MKRKLGFVTISILFVYMCMSPVLANYDFNGVSVGSGYTQIDYKTKTVNQGTTYINWTATSPSSSVTMTFKEMSDDNSYTYAYFSTTGTSASAAVSTSCIVGNSARFKASRGGILAPSVKIWGNWLP